MSCWRLYWRTCSSPGNGKQSLPHVYGSLRRAPPKEAELVRTAQQALARAADVMEKSASEPQDA
jgi:hypothetical protein